MQTIQQINNQTNNQRIYIEQLTMKREDIKLSKNAQKMFYLINQNKSLSIFEIEQIIKEYYNGLFYFKTTDYGIGAYSNCIPLNIFQASTAHQDRRLQRIKERNIAFIQNNLSLEGYNLSSVDIEKDFERYYEIANDLYKKKDKKEILKFIKTKIKENKDLQEQFKNKLLNPDEYFLKLKNDEKSLKKVYKDICTYVKRNKEGHIYPNPFTIESKMEDIKRNIKISKINARFKVIYNFHEENKISWLTLTLAHHNKNGTDSNETKDLTTAKKIVKIFMKKLIYLYTKKLKKKYNKEETKTKLKEFKYFIPSQQQQNGTWHFHIMFNIDLLKIFGATNKMLCQKKGRTFNSEFLENKEYYKENAKKYTKENGWYTSSNEYLIIPHIFKIWADVVQKALPQLKKLSPRAQNLQIFTKQNKKTIKKEIKECYLKKTFLKKDIATIIADYVSKYEAGLSDKEITKMIEQKQTDKINRNLFQFSRSCKKLVISKTLKYLPFDLQHSKYYLTGFYKQNILNFKPGHPFYYLTRNIVLLENNKRVVFKNNSPRALDFEENKNKYLIKMKKNKGNLSYFYCKFYFSLNKYYNHLNSKTFKKMYSNFKKDFNIDKLEKKIKLNKIEELKYYSDSSNYIIPSEERLRN